MKTQTQTKKLENGLTIVYIPRPETKLLNMGVYIAAGSLHEEGKYRLGTAHFLEHMVFNGTDKYPVREDLLDIVLKDGGSRGASTGWTHQVHRVATSRDYIAPSLEYLSQTLFYPLLREADFRKEKKIILSELERNDSDLSKKFAIGGMSAAVFENTALTNYSLGTEESIKGLTVGELKRFHAEFFVPSNMVFFVAGAIDFDGFISQVEEYFGDEESHASMQKIPAFRLVGEPQDKRMAQPGLATAKIACVQAFKCTRAEYEAMGFLFRILAFGTNSRLFKELREKRGLTYHVAPANFYLNGFLRVGIKTDSQEKNLEEIKRLFEEEIDRIASEGVSQDELDVKKKEHIQRVERVNDSTSGIFGTHVNYFSSTQEVYDQEIESERINALTVADIQAAAQRFQKGKSIWVVMSSDEQE